MQIIPSHIDFSYSALGNEPVSPPSRAGEVRGDCQANACEACIAGAFQRSVEQTACIHLQVAALCTESTR